MFGQLEGYVLLYPEIISTKMGNFEFFTGVPGLPKPLKKFMMGGGGQFKVHEGVGAGSPCAHL